VVSYFTVEASRLYDLARKQGVMGKIWSTLTRHSQNLLDLETTCRKVDVSNRHYAGVQTVAIEQIQGSEGRSREFDMHFHPLQSYTRERWLNMAVAQKQGRSLPPVELIRIGDIYFVRDGHHHISVAQMLGQEQIEAIVTVWETTGTLPWKPQVACDSSEEYHLLCENVCV